MYSQVHFGKYILSAQICCYISVSGIPYGRKASAPFLTKGEQANHINLFLKPLGACGTGPTAPGCRRMLGEQHDQSYLQLVQCYFQVK